MHYEYKTRGTCSMKILFDLEDNKVHNVSFIGGCNGNAQGVSKLAEGMDADEIIARIKGIRCVNASEEYTVKLSRHHNNSNMISIGARVVGTEKAISLMDTFLTEEFDGERHQRRIDLVDTL